MSDRPAFEGCVDQFGYDSIEILLECVTSTLEKRQKVFSDDNRSWLLILSGSLVFFMQAGFAMLCAGGVRKKNTQNTMLKNLLDACGAAIAFFLVGYAFAYGDENVPEDGPSTTVIGTTNFFSIGVDPAFWFFQYTFSAATVTIIAGTLAERCQMVAYLLYSVFLTGFVYPVVVHAIWSPKGFLNIGNDQPLLGSGMIDFAGSAVVHLTGGATALYASYILGSRRGRFYDIATGEPLAEPKEIKGHSVSLQMLGTLILWFGWHGFNPGSALLLHPDNTHQGEIGAHAAVNTSLAAAAGAISSLVVNLVYKRVTVDIIQFDLPCAMNGLLSGLVAITAGCGTVENWAAIVIGIFAGIIYYASSSFLILCKIDDALDAIPVHMFNGIWGVIATGLFSSPRLIQKTFFHDLPIDDFDTAIHPGFLYTARHGSSDNLDGTLIACQCIGVIFVLCFSFVTMVPYFLLLNYLGWFRCAPEDEIIGLDRHYHNDTNTNHTMNSQSVHSEEDRSSRRGEPEVEDEDIREYLEAYQRKKEQDKVEAEEHTKKKRKSAQKKRRSKIET